MTWNGTGVVKTYHLGDPGGAGADQVHKPSLSISTRPYSGKIAAVLAQRYKLVVVAAAIINGAPAGLRPEADAVEAGGAVCRATDIDVVGDGVADDVDDDRPADVLEVVGITAARSAVGGLHHVGARPGCLPCDREI